MDCIQPGQMYHNVFFNGKADALNTLLFDISAGSLATKKAILCVLVEDLSEPTFIAP